MTLPLRSLAESLVDIVLGHDLKSHSLFQDNKSNLNAQNGEFPMTGRISCFVKKGSALPQRRRHADLSRIGRTPAFAKDFVASRPVLHRSMPYVPIEPTIHLKKHQTLTKWDRRRRSSD